MTALRQAVPEDDRALAEISFECWAESNDPGDRWAQDRPFFGPPTDARVEDVIVATSSDRPVGYVRTLHRPSEYGDWYIAGLGVSPASQSMGVGRSLVEAALERAVIGGGARVWLKALSTNEPGLRLYRSLGFTEAARSSGAFTSRPGVDDLRLSIKLPPAP
ncbi:GNAT family N-acetyltransferase [Microbacterium sp. SORGH_AS_0428]|uniref:GNAT family N-acetyltransferase n=1 Tax=Microbacterium sp. SORGH_AS_0428 TaxID=3041788 RepID=UPI0037C7E589